MYNFYKDEPVLTQIHGPAIANPQEPDAANMLSHNYADPALAKIREAVRGNGLKAEMVSLTDIKGETAAFDAKVSMVLRTRTVEKIVGGKVNKIISEVTLLGQPYVLDTNVSVGDALKKEGADVISVARLAVGEGIEKVEEDFAAEVMKQAGLA